MQAHADIVKKGYLKYKASKVKGKIGACAGPKTSYKELYVVLRAPSGAEKYLDFYQSDRKYAEIVQPKWTVDLSAASTVDVMNDNRMCFYMEHVDGALCLFEGKSVEEAEDWMSCFNAVLFTKGMHGEDKLYYEVDLLQSDLLPYHGPAYLELTDGYLIIWTRGTQEEVVKWKLSHIRSFKAKKVILTIYTGSRSSTGVGEFCFSSPKSVQITHAIETLVARLKSQNLQSRSGRPRSERRPLPPAPAISSQFSTHKPPEDIPNLIEYYAEGPITSSISATIPGFNPLDVYEDIPDNFGEESGSVFYPPEETRQGGASSSHLSPHREKFGRVELNGRAGKISPHTSPKQIRKRIDYEDIPDGPFEEAEQNGNASPSPPFSAKNGKKERQKSPLPFRKTHKSPPPLPKPYQPSQNKQETTTEVSKAEALYAVVDKSAKKSRQRPMSVMPAGASRLTRKQLSSSNPNLAELDTDVQTPSFTPEEYGKLSHANKPSSSQTPSFTPEEYGKLSHANKPSSTQTPDEYGRLEHAQPNAAVGGFRPEEYGKLERSQEDPTPSEYGRLENNEDSPPDVNGYGRLENNRRSSFDPYGTLTAAELERQIEEVKTLSTQSSTNEQKPKPKVSGYETMDFGDEETADGAIYSEIDDKQSTKNKLNVVRVPPPGYENAILKKLTPAEQASYKAPPTRTNKLNSSPPTPPRSHSQKHGYVNVNEDGSITRTEHSEAPIVPRRNRSNDSSSTPSPTDGKQKVLKKVHSMEESLKDDEFSPPPPPKRGASVHGTNSNRCSPPRTKKPPPPAAPKPKIKPIVKQKPVR